MNHMTENNLALNKLFKIAAKQIPLQEMLADCLDILLNLSWLSILPKGAVFLSSKDDKGNNVLRLVVERNLGNRISSLCAQVPWGQCLCGRAALTGQSIHTSCIDERHETTFDGIDPHGHYVVPILANDNALGVLVFYLPHGAECDSQNLEFLEHSAAVISLALELRRKEYELEIINRELSFQKNTLDLHAIVSIADVKGAITYANDKFCEISGYSRDELIGQNHRILKSTEHSSEFYHDLWKTITNGQVWHGEIKNLCKDGSEYWVSATIVPFMDQRGKPFQYVAVRTDISRRKQVEYALKQAQSVAQIGSWCLDLHLNDLEWSDEIFNIFGVDKESFGASFEAFLDMVHPEDREYVIQQYQGSIELNLPYDIEHRIVRKDNGEIRWVHEKCVHQRNAKGEILRSDGTVQDVTQRKLAQEEIKRLALTDNLTGLSNRHMFNRRFNDLLKLAKREKIRLVLLLIDLDKFKPVNDTYGHQVGDTLLQKVASVFTGCVRETDLVARLGGDEFAILLFNPENTRSVDSIATKIIEHTSMPVQVHGLELQIGSSIGISVFPDNGTDLDTLYHKADKALYDSKNSGRNTFRYCA